MLLQQRVADAPHLVDVSAGIAMAEADIGDAQPRQRQGLRLRLHRRVGAAKGASVHRCRVLHRGPPPRGCHRRNARVKAQLTMALARCAAFSEKAR